MCISDLKKCLIFQDFFWNNSLITFYHKNNQQFIVIQQRKDYHNQIVCSSVLHRQEDFLESISQSFEVLPFQSYEHICGSSQNLFNVLASSSYYLFQKGTQYSKNSYCPVHTKVTSIFPPLFDIIVLLCLRSHQPFNSASL